MRPLTIQFRIAAWYLFSSVSILAVFSVGSWFAMRSSMLHSTDRSLNYRMKQVIAYVQAHSVDSEEDLKEAFGVGSSAPIVGVFVQFTSDDSRIVFESDVLRSHNVVALGVGPADGSVTTKTVGDLRKWPVRVLSKRILVSHVPLTVHLVEPLRDFLNALREYVLDLCGLVVAALLLITTAGYFLSKKALAPVERIRKEAEAIDPHRLASRLPVPRTEDELKRLAITLNAMLSRIESGFVSVQQFTADASHELRTPLALIITLAEVTLRRERSPRELQDALKKVIVEAGRMSVMVEQLLGLARGDVAGALQEASSIDIGPLVREICREFDPIAAARGLSISCIASAGEFNVMASEAEVRRVLFILLDNAVKYTEFGSIAVTVACQAHRVELTVRDTGSGIDSEDIPRLFDRFWRTDKVRSRGTGGAGLGLSLASQIVTRRGGQIIVESRPGEGSNFKVSYPAKLKPADGSRSD